MNTEATSTLTRVRFDTDDAMTRGVKRMSGSCSTHRDPLVPEDLVNIFGYLDLGRDEDLVFWAAMTLSFRCLLRRSHVMASCHSLRVSDFVFCPDGLDVTIRSSKTNQYAHRSVCIPVLKSKGSLLCPVKYIRPMLSRLSLEPDSHLAYLLC